MAIIKVKKKENPFLQIDKEGIEDKNLSWGATGLLAYLVGRPDNWEININHLAGVKKNKRESTKNALNELREYGYCHYFEIREKGRVIQTTYLIFENKTPSEEAQNLLGVEEKYKIIYKAVALKKPVVSPKTGKPLTVKSLAENLDIIIKDSNNKKDNNEISSSNKEKKTNYNFLNSYNLNNLTIANINRHIKDLTEKKFKEVYNKLKSDPRVQSIDKALYKALKGEWEFTAQETRGGTIEPKKDFEKAIKRLVDYYNAYPENTDRKKEMFLKACKNKQYPKDLYEIYLNNF